jgi:hypothetical protein
MNGQKELGQTRGIPDSIVRGWTYQKLLLVTAVDGDRKGELLLRFPVTGVLLHISGPVNREESESDQPTTLIKDGFRRTSKYCRSCPFFHSGRPRLQRCPSTRFCASNEPGQRAVHTYHSGRKQSKRETAHFRCGGHVATMPLITAGTD